MFIEIPASKVSLTARKLLFGVGINDACYMVYFTNKHDKKLRCPYYVAWASMLKRCYSVSFLKNNPTYIGCSTTASWLTFSNFRLWMEKQNWKGKQLDKDILINGNKIYSPSACLFVEQSINNLLCDRARARGIYPQGVSLCKKSNLILSGCSVNGKRKHLGCFNTPEEAHEVYKQFKSKHILEVAEEYKSEPRLYEALKNHARLMLL